MRNMEAFGVGGIDYLDQIMLDYPGPSCDSIRGQWSSFEEMHAQKLTKSISVSNFNLDQLDCVLKTATVKPVVNQLPYNVAYHPGSVTENNKRGLLVQAWAPLGKFVIKLYYISVLMIILFLHILICLLVLTFVVPYYTSNGIYI